MATTSLDSRYYTDPAVHAAERAAIFRVGWHPIGSVDEFVAAGDYKVADIAGSSVFVIRGGDGVLRGFHNVCSHRGAQLLDAGSGHCEQVRCPYHGWLYDDRGQLSDTPWFDTASPFDKDTLPLQGVQVSVWRKLVFVAIEPTSALEDQLGDLPGFLVDDALEGLTLGGSSRFQGEANWKAYIEQFLEFYHVPAVHGADKSSDIQHYSAEPHRHAMLMTAPPGVFYGGKWLWGWPAWTLSLFPGGMKVSRLNPLAVDAFELTIDYWFADLSPDTAAVRQRVMDTTADIFRQDNAAAARVQAGHGFGSYRPGPLHPDLEKATAYFQQCVRAALDGR